MPLNPLRQALLAGVLPVRFEGVMKAVLTAKVDEQPRSVNRTPTKVELETRYKLRRNLKE